MLNATTPLFTVLIGIVFFRQRFTGRQWAGIIAGLAGALSLGLLQPHGIEVNAFVLPVVLATLLYALNVNLLKSKFSNVPPLALSAATIVAVGPAALVLLLGFTDFTTRLFTLPGALQAIGYVAILGVFSTAIALVLFNRLIQIAGPLVASSVTYMMPVVSVMWGIIDGEPMGAGRIFGLFGILAGVYLVNRKS
jgi:drug/metabolite transporter (DMT)-like permease